MLCVSDENAKLQKLLYTKQANIERAKNITLSKFQIEFTIAVSVRIRTRGCGGSDRRSAAVPQLKALTPLQILTHGLRTFLELGEEFPDQMILSLIECGIVLTTLGQFFFLFHVGDFAEDELEEKRIEKMFL